MTQAPDGNESQGPPSERFPDEGQVGFDTESAPDEALHVGPDGAGTPAGDVPPAADAADQGGDQAEGDPLEEMRGTIGELTGDLKRLQAEYLNYKRRVDRDRDLVVQNARLSVLNGLLPVLDDIERAREHEELSGGFRAVAEGLERVVSGAGLERFGAPGDEFDPRLHEALSHGYAEPGQEVTTTTCQHVVQAGYQFGERVVRPAKVVVVDPPPEQGESGAE